jgi:serine/threonine-protein kinase
MHLTKTGLVLGTAYYLPPEQAAGKPVTPASDLYALGVVAYECLTGARPFTGDNPVNVAVAHLRDEPPGLPDEVPEPVRRFVMSLLEKDPLARPASAADVATAARALEGDPTDSSDALTAQLAPLADATTSALPVDGTEVVADEPARPKWSANAYPGQQRTRSLLLLVGLAVVVVGAVLLVLVGGGGHGKKVVGSTPSPTPQPSPTLGTVALASSAYTGRPYADVARALQTMGLTVHRKNQSSTRPADTVIGIAPSGPVPMGSTVTVTVATAPPAPEKKKPPGHHGKGGND